MSCGSTPRSGAGGSIANMSTMASQGKKASRPAMNRLLKAARQRAIDAVVCWKLDGWGRSMPHLVQSVQELKSLGVRFVAVSQGSTRTKATLWPSYCCTC